MKILLALLVGTSAIYLRYNFLTDNFDPEQVKGARVLITGASTGIGEQIAYHYAKLGAKIMITARREATLKQVIAKCKEIGSADGEYYYFPADMSEQQSYANVVKEATSKLGGIDYLILNHIKSASMGNWDGSTENITFFHETMDVNFRAYVHIVSHAMPVLEKSSGVIMVVSSVAGKLGVPYTTSYCASKFALQGFFTSFQKELRLRGSRVSVSIATIGNIATERAIQALNDFGLNRIVEKLPGADPSETALAIVRGATLREREVYFPYLQARMGTMFRDVPVISEILEMYTNYLYSDAGVN